MKKIIYIILIALVFSGFNSCTDDFEKTNTNRNKFYTADLDYVFPGTVSRTMKLIGELNYNRLINFSRYGIVQFATNPGQDEGDSYFSQYYVGIIRDLEVLDRQYEGNEGARNRLAIVKTWKSYVYYMAASMYGSIPMSDAITNGNENKRSYKYDTELEIYTDILDMLATADTLYMMNSPYSADILTSDPVFGGAADGKADLNKWRKFTNTLRLNIAMHVQNLSPELSRKHATDVMADETGNKLISSLDDMVKLQWGKDEATSASYYYTRFIKNMTNFEETTYPAISEYFSIYLFSYNDPRIEAYCRKGNEMAPSGIKPYLYTDTITRPHICTKRDCPDNTEHLGDGYNYLRRDSILVDYSMPYVPLFELNSLAFGWEYAIIPGTIHRYHDILSRKNSPYNYSFVHPDFIKETAAMILYNLADVYFLKAEAKLLYGIGASSAEEYYNEGIKASFAQYGMSGKVSDYMKQDGIKWNTNGEGYADRRLLYRANINGEGGVDNHLEQIYKQRYFADFFNCFEGWNLERRTRVMSYPPFFANGASSSAIGADNTYNYWTERFIYPLAEVSKNKNEYYKGIENLRAVSPFFREDRWGDNIFTSLGFSKLNPDLANANEKYKGNKQIVINCEYFNKKYGSTYEEVVVTAKQMSGETNENKALTKAFDYAFRERLSTYFVTPPPTPEPEPEPEP